MPHGCQVKVVFPALFCWYSAFVFIDQPRALQSALQSFSAAVSPHTGVPVVMLRLFAPEHRISGLLTVLPQTCIRQASELKLQRW